MTELSTADMASDPAVNVAVDVTIVGAGPAGSAAAIALCNGGINSVALIDSQSESPFRYGESANPGVRQQLSALGLSTDLTAQGHLTCRGSCSLWGNEQLAYKDFHSMLHGYGWHLDRAKFDHDLLQQAREAGANVRTGIKLTELRPLKDSETQHPWQLHLSNGEKLKTSFVIDATGRKAVVATAAGAKRHPQDRLVAVVLTLDIKSSELLAHRSLVESAPDGWWYATAIPGERTVVMFMSDSDLIRELGVHTRKGFFDYLNRSQQIKQQLDLQAINPTQGPEPEIIGAISQRMEPVVGPDWIAIGDAAIGLDPLTSSGISSALEDGLQAAKAIIALKSGDPSQLQVYETRISEAWQSYLQQRQQHYQNERRWAKNAFWQRRHRSPEQS